jgi:2-iminoacetate synthase
LDFEHLLLVTGEHQTKVGMDYFRQPYSGDTQPF